MGVQALKQPAHAWCWDCHQQTKGRKRFEPETEPCCSPQGNPTTEVWWSDGDWRTGGDRFDMASDIGHWWLSCRSYLQLNGPHSGQDQTYTSWWQVIGMPVVVVSWAIVIAHKIWSCIIFVSHSCMVQVLVMAFITSCTALFNTQQFVNYIVSKCF